MKLRRGEPGYSLVALMASVTIMLLMLGAALPSWRYVVKDDREEELIFRGGQIADAIQRFQRKNGNALPPSLEVLVRGRYLRKLYRDPMTPEGKWRLVHQGEPLASGAPPAGGTGTTGTTPPTTRPPGPGGTTGQTMGPIIGVASTSREQGLRLFNGRQRYNEWIFAAGQPRVVGKLNVGPVPPRVPGPGGVMTPVLPSPPQ